MALMVGAGGGAPRGRSWSHPGTGYAWGPSAGAGEGGGGHQELAGPRGRLVSLTSATSRHILILLGRI